MLRNVPKNIDNTATAASQTDGENEIFESSPVKKESKLLEVTEKNQPLTEKANRQMKSSQDNQKTPDKAVNFFPPIGFLPESERRDIKSPIADNFFNKPLKNFMCSTTSSSNWSPEMNVRHNHEKVPSTFSSLEAEVLSDKSASF